jgi:FdhD protein
MPASSVRYPSAIARLPVQKITADHSLETDDPIAVEEPLEISLQYGPSTARRQQSISVTMRTPGQDAELAIGFLFTEGIIPGVSAILSIDQGQAQQAAGTSVPCNRILLSLQEQVPLDLGKLQRHFYTSSSCGVCGKTSIAALRTVCSPAMSGEEPPVDAGIFYSLPFPLRQQQDIFNSTGGIHAAALFDRQGHLISLREDIGRHNALDKLIGSALLQEGQRPSQDAIRPLSSGILLLSGRACFELIQKAAMAGIRIVAAIGPPSSLAVQLAEEQQMTLIGFLRDQRFNIYSGAHRIRV